eukprot:788717-Pleurochrysis_carterae.AAC.1
MLDSHNHDDSQLLLDAWARCVIDAVDSGDENIMCLIENGAVPFHSAEHGWFGVFPHRGDPAAMYGVPWQ